MISSSELTDFYYKELHATLQELEKEREDLKYRIIIIGVIYTVIALLIVLSVLSMQASLDAIIFIGFAYFGIGGFLYKLLTKNYAANFKDKVISPLIKAIDKNLNYDSHRHIDPLHFKRSKLFTSEPDRVRGNDYVYGHIDSISIQFSDFHAEKKHKDSKGRTTWSTIFQGLFIVSEFNKNFHGTTVVLPDTAQSTFGDLIGNFLQSKNAMRQELVKMDDVEFEREFVVYSSDQVEARYILTHTLMKRLLNYKKRTGEDVLVSFTSKNINIAIAYNKDLFEPSVFHSLLKYKVAMEYVQTLHLATGIVEELKLNKKLWSKL
ncbi:MAG: DUF3137 domain-containing protein [Campylobacterales bacterium]|nr:DUF3137 domain-containing protein [Campylobacterales bacterium]